MRSGEGDSIMFKTTLAACAVLVLAATPAAAEPSARSMELARRYVKALHMENTVGTMMGNMAPMMLDRLAQRLNAQVHPELKTAYAEAVEETTRAMTPKMIDAMLPALAETFTEAELEAAVTYYESAQGQSLMAKMPAYMARATPAMMALTPELEADLEARLCKKVACESEPAR